MFFMRSVWQDDSWIQVQTNWAKMKCCPSSATVLRTCSLPKTARSQTMTLMPFWSEEKGRWVWNHHSSHQLPCTFFPPCIWSIYVRCFLDHGDEGEAVVSGWELSQKLHHGHREQQRVHIWRRRLQGEEKGKMNQPNCSICSKTSTLHALGMFISIPSSLFLSGHYKLDRATQERTESQLCRGCLL